MPREKLKLSFFASLQLEINEFSRISRYIMLTMVNDCDIEVVSTSDWHNGDRLNILGQQHVLAHFDI